MAKPKTDPRVTKRRVTMRKFVLRPPAEPGGDPTVQTHEAVDYVNPEILEAYVADARTRWDDVAVSDVPDAGPGGYHGQTAISHRLDHPEAGTVRPATEED